MEKIQQSCWNDLCKSDQSNNDTVITDSDAGRQMNACEQEVKTEV